MLERINAKVVDEGDGCFTLVADSLEEAARLRVILSPSSCGLGVTYEDPELEPVVEEVESLPQELEAMGLYCPLEPDRAWDDSACAMVTGWTEEEALAELAKMELLTEVKRLRDEGVV